jgi:hypothetical protein
MQIYADLNCTKYALLHKMFRPLLKYIHFDQLFYEY